MYMQKTVTFLVSMLITISVFAQSPDKMSYQAVVRDGSDALVASAAVGMQISILQGSADGTAVYIETQAPASNANGLVSIEIGTGTTSDDFTTIDWANGPYYLKTEIDPEGGTSYIITGTSELMSVSFALHATTAENGISPLQANAITANTAKVGITSMQADEIAANTEKTGITAAQADEITINTLKTGITTAQATKLAGIEEGAAVNVQANADWYQTTPTTDDDIKNLPFVYPAADGSETKVTAGANITVTGNGTTANPYVINAAKAATLAIGQSYQGGKIFWLDATGKHGLIVAATDQSPGSKWYAIEYLATNAVRDGIGAGIYNTERIIANQGDIGADFASSFCSELQSGGYSDWYLPSKYELNLLYIQRAAVGGFGNNFYWSSNENNSTTAWYQYFGNGAQNIGDKFNNARVRAIRTF